MKPYAIAAAIIVALGLLTYAQYQRAERHKERAAVALQTARDNAEALSKLEAQRKVDEALVAKWAADAQRHRSAVDDAVRRFRNESKDGCLAERVDPSVDRLLGPAGPEGSGEGVSAGGDHAGP